MAFTQYLASRWADVASHGEDLPWRLWHIEDREKAENFTRDSGALIALQAVILAWDFRSS